MKVDFSKYHGNGNDFIIIDNRHHKLNLSSDQISKLCHRRFGIGSDGLIMINHCEEADYEMDFYNPDASQSFCGNGSRCSLHFSREIGMISNEATIKAIDGLHKGWIEGDMTRLEISPVESVKKYEDCYFVDTGSPHAVIFTDDVQGVDIDHDAPKFRYDDRFKPGGCNVNFVQFMKFGLKSRVYERGVEDETYSSGSGTTAQALCAFSKDPSIGNEVVVETMGGPLTVTFNDDGKGGFDNIVLKGQVSIVYSGTVEL